MRFGIGPCVYRSTGEIQADIGRVLDKISEIKERFNLRALLLEIINDERLGNPKELAAMLEDALARAEDANRDIKALREELKNLEEELLETKCEMGI